MDTPLRNTLASQSRGGGPGAGARREDRGTPHGQPASPRCPGSAGSSFALRFCLRPRASRSPTHTAQPSPAAPTASPVTSSAQAPGPFLLLKPDKAPLTVHPSSASIPDHDHEASPHAQAGTPELTRHDASPTRVSPHPGRAWRSSAVLHPHPEPGSGPFPPHTVGGQDGRWGTQLLPPAASPKTRGGGGWLPFSSEDTSAPFL